MASETSHGWAVFANRDFVLLLIARFFSMTSVTMVGVAVGWQLYDLTGRPMDLGWIGFAQFVPALVLTLVTGWVADRLDRRLVLSVSHLAAAACALMLYVLAATGHVTLLSMMAVLALLASSRAFSLPAMQAIGPGLVPREQFGATVAWSSTVNKMAMIGGPALGGLIYALGAGAVYAAAAGSLLLSAGLMLAIRRRGAEMHPDPLSLTSALAGVRFLRRNPQLLGAISLDAVAVLLGGVTALLPIYAKDILAVGPAGLGLLRSAPSVGAAIVAVTLAARPLGRQAGALMLWCVAGYGVATLVFGLSTSFALSLAALLALGAVDMCSVFVRQTLVQLGTPDAMRGRVSAINALFLNTSNQLGQFESGLAAALFGVVPSVLLGGVGTLAVVAAWNWRFPDLRRIDLSPAGIAALEARTLRAAAE